VVALKYDIIKKQNENDIPATSMEIRIEAKDKRI